MRHAHVLAASLAILVCAAATGLSLRGAGGLDLSWHTIDGGGGTSTGGGFDLSGTIGQYDAGGPMTGGTFSVTGGFWVASVEDVPVCTVDLNGDGVIDVNDLLLVVAAWGTPGADVTGDGMTDVDDLLEVVAAWGPCP